MDECLNASRKLIASHLSEGIMEPGEEIGLMIDQTLTQDATGTMVMLELEAMGIDKVRTSLSAQYVDHQLIQTDHKNPDDHRFLQSACRRWGIWYSRPGNGISHPVHMTHFGKPGLTLVGSDSHTPAGGAIGMLSVGAGGLEVAMSMAGKPLYIKMPEIWGVKVEGTLPDWVSAKDVILEMLRRHGVKGGRGRIIEYYGPGVKNLTAWDRHVICNMGTELGATSSVFPSDDTTQSFFNDHGRSGDFTPLTADDGSEYDHYEEIDLTGIEPLIALSPSPGNVVPVRDVAGQEISQSYIGSSANPGLRDFAVPALMVDSRTVGPGVSFDINPSTRDVLLNLTHMGLLEQLIKAGARIHQAGCNGCIGMGQAPATDTISLRTVPRNFADRSGTLGDKVHLCSPETATASALTGVITDPRDIGTSYPKFIYPQSFIVDRSMFIPPTEDGGNYDLVKGPNIKSLPRFEPMPNDLTCSIVIKLGDNVSTDEIMPAGVKILPFRSNVPEISKFVFSRVDAGFYARAMAHQKNGFMIVGGENYGQGSSREHAALAPRYLGLRAVIARSFARIHWQNLVNFGILPLTFKDPSDWVEIEEGDEIAFSNIRTLLNEGHEIPARNVTKGIDILTMHRLSGRQVESVLAGSLLYLA